MKNEAKQPSQERAALWGRPLTVVNIGLELFGVTLDEQNIPVVHVDWAPPAGGRRELLGLLDELVD